VTTAYDQGKKIGFLVMEKLTGQKPPEDKLNGNDKITASKQQ